MMLVICFRIALKQQYIYQYVSVNRESSMPMVMVGFTASLVPASILHAATAELRCGCAVVRDMARDTGMCRCRAASAC